MPKSARIFSLFLVKKYRGRGGGGGPEQRGGGSPVFELLVVGHSIFSYPIGVGYPVFFFWGGGIGTHLTTIEASDTLKHQLGVDSHVQLFLPH